jgi:hypothetical protein
MNWENIVKKKKLIGGQKKLDKDNDGDIDAEDFASIRMEKQADCKVTVCDATNCMYNANKRCTLDEITINSKGKCDYFVVRKDKMPEPKYVNFTPKTVDRLKRTVRENPTQGINEELNERRR